MSKKPVTEQPFAKYFNIKAFTEENVLKSIKYGIWSSGVGGNKKLNEAFKKCMSSPSQPECPIYLFFSVNRSA